MKKLSLLVLVMMLVGLTSFCQIDSIKVTPNGLTNGFIKTNLSSEILYERTIKWVNETYKNPESVLVGKVENKSITINGFSNSAVIINGMGGIKQFYDLHYHIYINLKDSIINYKFEIDRFTYNSQPSPFLDINRWFKDDGTYKEKLWNTAKPTLENSINNLFFLYVNKINDSSLSSDEAISKLKKAKDKLDLGLITQEEYDKIKNELIQYIK